MNIFFFNIKYSRAFTGILLILTLISIQPAFTQNAKGLNAATSIAGKTNWSSNPFDVKVFIENKGQFDNKNNIQSSHIKFAINNMGEEIYFTSGGLTYTHDEFVQLNREEMAGAANQNHDGSKKENDGEEQRPLTKIVSYFVNMNWDGSNPDVKIIAGDSVSFYFTYPDTLDQSGKSCIKAVACRKITYQNIYPDIDVVYTFPENKPGIEYSLILHPGANVSVIKMHYSQMSNIALDENGNIQLETPFGNIIDHAPYSYTVQGIRIESGFELSGTDVSFKLNKPEGVNYDQQTIIIDPWTTDPLFSGYDAAYDVNYDFAGNIYIYGGGSPWKEMKFNSSGSLQWTFTTAFWTGGCTSGPCYGDFAVDGASESSYIIEAFRNGSGTRVVKLDGSGNLAGTFGGDSVFSEMWRIVFNNCTRQAVIGGGNIYYTYQACILDTNLNNMTPVNVLGASDEYHDICLLALGNDSNCYMASSEKATEPGTLDNVLLRCPANTLSPNTYMVSDGHHFSEVASVSYVDNIRSNANGYNGIAVNNEYVYTYDGSVLKQLYKSTGIFKDSVTLSGTTFSWGGIDVNDCNNIFAGVNSSILQLDSNLNIVATIPVANTVYDLKLGPGNMLYVCGNEFVSTISLTTTCNSSSLNLSTSFTPESCLNNGTATATVANGIGPYTYLWSPSGQTTQTATGLSAGTYTVIVTDTSFSPCGNVTGGTQTDSVTVPEIVVTALVSPDTTICAGSFVQLKASGGENFVWSPSASLDSANIATPNALPTTTTTYTVTVSSSNCSSTATVTINVVPNPPTPTITQSNDTLYCSTNPAYSSYQWYFNNAIVPNATDTFFIEKENGNYNIAVRDSNGCSVSVGIIILGMHAVSSDNSVSLYPNPANDQITLSATSIHENEAVLVSVIDVLGQIIQQENIYWRDRAIINIKDLSSGIYFLQLQQPQGRWIGRFAKE